MVANPAACRKSPRLAESFSPFVIQGSAPRRFTPSSALGLTKAWRHYTAPGRPRQPVSRLFRNRSKIGSNRSGESQNGAWPELLIRCFLPSQRLENGIVSPKSVLTNGSSAPLRTAIGGVLPATTLCHAGSNRLWLRHAGNVSLRPGEAVS
jgi:hypothetical protein